MLAGHAGLVNHGDKMLRILGRKIIYAGVVLARHVELMNPGDEILSILGEKIIYASQRDVAMRRRNETSQ